MDCFTGTPESKWFGNKIGGDRLKEAIGIGNSRAYKEFFEEHFAKYTKVEGNKHWWIPIKHSKNFFVGWSSP